MGEKEKELDEYGVWVTTEEDTIAEDSDLTTNEKEDFNFGVDEKGMDEIEIDFDNQAINQSEDDFFIFDDEEKIPSDETQFIPLEWEEGQSFDEKQTSVSALQESNPSDIAPTPVEEIPVSYHEEISLSQPEELQTQEEEMESYDSLEENLFTDETEKETIGDIDLYEYESDENQGDDKMNEQTDVLQTILTEIKTIKIDIENIKDEINELKKDKCCTKSSDEDFFDDDEKISLSSDELDELNDLNITEENFSDEENSEEMTLDQELNAKMENDSFAQDLDAENDDFGINLADSAWSEQEPIPLNGDFESSNEGFSSAGIVSLEEELNAAKGKMIGSVEDMMYNIDEDPELESKLNDNSFDSLIDTENYNTAVFSDENLLDSNESFAKKGEEDHFQSDREDEAEANQEISFELDGANTEEDSSESEALISFAEKGSNESPLDFEEDLDFQTPPSFEQEAENDLNVAAKVNEELAKAEDLDEDLEFEDFTIENLEDENDLDLEEEKAENDFFSTPSGEMGTFSKSDLVALLSYLDNLLDALPDEKIKEFANSSYFDLYKKAFKELGIKE